ncbi:rod-binding protein [Paucibacter sediminis]|uniref:Rod-binding protein n=1 Tax=Paucibacter sediminis TaxID=3019553 RepID=A0AA95NKL5_9BURK|nr:rod-binding protein [Paucibacter sp. S2-9]WIT11381.1 rod-binding protein [Paucibacter sp. S2-9]
MPIQLHPDAQPGAAGDDALLRAKAGQAAEKFEAFFIKQMLSQMRAATRELADEGSVFKNRVNQDMQDLADGLVADSMAQQRAFGIADVILKQLLPADLSAGPKASP